MPLLRNVFFMMLFQIILFVWHLRWGWMLYVQDNAHSDFSFLCVSIKQVDFFKKTLKEIYMIILSSCKAAESSNSCERQFLPPGGSRAKTLASWCDLSCIASLNKGNNSHRPPWTRSRKSHNGQELMRLSQPCFLLTSAGTVWDMHTQQNNSQEVAGDP